MEPTTLRLPEDMAEDLTEEAEELGYSSRSEYIRQLLRNRSGGEPNTQRNRSDTGPNTPESSLSIPEDLDEQLDELRSRIKFLETATSDGDVELEESDSEQTTEPAEETAADTTTSSASSVDDENKHENVALQDVINDVARSWTDDPQRIETRKQAALAVLEYAREHGAVSKKEAKEELYPEHPVEGQNPRTWYRKNIRPVLNEVAEYDQSLRAYRLTID